VNRLSPRQRDLVLIALLLLILLAAFPLIGSLFTERVAAPPSPTPTEQSLLLPVVTFSPLPHPNNSLSEIN
jgi:hypothetical protein